MARFLLPVVVASALGLMLVVPAPVLATRNPPLVPLIRALVVASIGSE